MKENRINSIEKILEAEGGYVDHPRDPGGCTNMGITIGTLRTRRSAGAPVTCLDVKNLTKKEARVIYSSRYWDKVGGDSLPAGLDLLVFDMAVNAGPRRAAKMLQNMVGVDNDGEIGPITLKAVGRMARAEAGVEEMIHQYSAARRSYYRSLPTYDTFGRGWINRTDEKEKEAIEMFLYCLGAVPAPAPVSTEPAEPEPEEEGSGTDLERLDRKVELLSEHIERIWKKLNTVSTCRNGCGEGGK